ncbi:DnaA/Hda family protein [Kaistia dalseonensis]|uniref:Chromosomal replication initiation ATPase DnaA n=1 Tax=Kaistia dalseonensis TaxID=410840 RepID=A0ABU0H0I6_9HYPH|nr:DnaA/Hda family protein [Kaistia dalseonensis]MCX5493259.1 DnaA/Hda family protein [Kaistia dalseonensis]MDQ0435816.1 chromosomal replication initiation ATPase DnaA [Kaistia dalseonensis]
MSTTRNSPARQLALTLPHMAALTRADFLVGSANEAAVHLIDRFPDWPNRVALLIGPVGSGKTHLGQIWREASGASEIAARDLGRADFDALFASGRVLVEDLHAGPVDQAALFHFLNLVREREAHALLTSRESPAALGFSLPDLASRLRAAVPVVLQEPDDELLARVIVKLFADRQIAVDPPLVDFIRRRMDRSLESANRLVALLDQEALAAGRPITRQLAANVLARELGEAPESDLD